MHVWPFLLALCGAVTLVAAFVRHGPSLAIGAGMLCAYGAGRLIKWLDLDYQLASFAAIWIAAGFAASISRHNRAGLIASLLVACGLCYVWARIGGAAWRFGSLPFVLSDFFAVSAMLILGAGLWHDFIGRASYLVRGAGGRSFDFGSGCAKSIPQEAAQKAGQ